MLDPLRAGAVAGDRGRTAGAAPIRDRLAMPTVVTGEVVPRAVKDERHLALWAHPHLTAPAAGEKVRPPAAVEQHYRLAGRASQLGERRAGLGVQRVVAAAHVEQLDWRQRPAVDPLGQHEPRGGQRALRTRGGASQHKGGAVLLGPAGGDRARVVSRVAFVLVGALVLLVDDHQPDVRQGSEHSRARPHADSRLA